MPPSRTRPVGGRTATARSTVVGGENGAVMSTGASACRAARRRGGDLDGVQDAVADQARVRVDHNHDLRRGPGRKAAQVAARAGARATAGRDRAKRQTGRQQVRQTDCASCARAVIFHRDRVDHGRAGGDGRGARSLRRRQDRERPDRHVGGGVVVGRSHVRFGRGDRGEIGQRLLGRCGTRTRAEVERLLLARGPACRRRT